MTKNEKWVEKQFFMSNKPIGVYKDTETCIV